MKRALILIISVAVVFFIIGCGADENHGAVAMKHSLKTGYGNQKQVSPIQKSIMKADPTPSSDAFRRPGPQQDGGFMLPNGRMINPAGDYLMIKRFATDIKVSPLGNMIVANSMQNAAVQTIDPDALTVTLDEQRDTFSGIIFNAAGTKFWVAGGAAEKIWEYDVTGTTAVLSREIEALGFPAGLALNSDATRLYFSCNMGNAVDVIDLSTGLVADTYKTQVYPYGIALVENKHKIYAANWGSGTVSVINLNNGGVIHIQVGENPSAVVKSPDGSKIYVANSDDDSISVISTTNDTVVAAWDLHDPNTSRKGAWPNSMDITSDGKKLYISCGGYDSVDVIDTTNGQVLGRIPTGWYPTGVSLDEANNRLFVVNAKGNGSAATGGPWVGGMQRIAIPNSSELAAYTQTVENCIRIATTFYDPTDPNFQSPIPHEIGAPSEQIKHVIFILKENKTFDEVLGDLETAEHDPSHCIFCGENTQNTHAFAARFTTLDNMYVEGDTSVIGHIWCTGSVLNDYDEKTWLSGGREPIPGIEPASFPSEGLIFHNLLDHGIEFRAYGQIVGLGSDIERFGPYMDFKYGFWNMRVSDEIKVDEIIREIEAGIFPPFVYISLPNNHSYGSDPGKPTPRWLVADNDAALGKFVDYISHSDYWADTAIFVTEDDPQGGSDHIDPHRTVTQVISPWAKTGHISSVIHSDTSIFLTMELILGIPPLYKFDEFTAPLYDSFTMTPNSEPYTKIDNPYPYETNPTDGPMAEESHKQDWTGPDKVKRLGEILWAVQRPGEPFPYNKSVDGMWWSKEETLDENDNEKSEWDASLQQVLDYAKLHGLEVGLGYQWGTDQDVAY